LWKESESVKDCNEEDKIDIGYYEEMAEEAKEAISKFGDFETFVRKGDL